MKHKCCFVIPYFGKLPNYFNVFLKTCSYNSDFDWLIFTDDKEPLAYPQNVEVIYTSFDELKNLIGKKLNLKISFDEPHKLCDFKPAYGYIFESYLEKYDFWGHCDPDIVMGNLKKFITDDLLRDYDKLFCLGHMVLYRNNYENNRIFMNAVDGEYWYKESFESAETTVFDEVGAGEKHVHNIFLKENRRVLEEDWSMNCSVEPTRFIRTAYNAKNKQYEIEKYKDALYIWKQGELFRMYKSGNDLIREDFLYMHLQSRKMKNKMCVEEYDQFKILENQFLPLEIDNINLENWNKIKRHAISFRWFKLQYRWKKNAIKRILKKIIS